MKYVWFGLVLVGLVVPAWAAEPPTVILPSPLIAQIYQYLNSRPYGEVKSIQQELEGCIAVQMPEQKAPAGACPALAASSAPPQRPMPVPVPKDRVTPPKK